jgi:hypothetical protein
MQDAEPRGAEGNGRLLLGVNLFTPSSRRFMEFILFTERGVLSSYG